MTTDLGDNATIEKVGPPEKVIDAFGPELVGQNVEGEVKDMEVKEHDGRTYYLYELKVPHVLITATAAGNRLYLMTVSGNGKLILFDCKNLKVSTLPLAFQLTETVCCILIWMQYSHIKIAYLNIWIQ